MAVKDSLERIEAAFRLLGDLELSAGVVKGALVSSAYEYKTIREELDNLHQSFSYFPWMIEDMSDLLESVKIRGDKLKELL